MFNKEFLFLIVLFDSSTVLVVSLPVLDFVGVYTPPEVCCSPSLHVFTQLCFGRVLSDCFGDRRF